MAAEQSSDGNPLEQFVELLVYAPVGLLYEYQEVLPRLVKRGKSQVQLARLVGKMAANQARSASPGRADGVTDAVQIACSLLSRAVTEVGANMGLAPRESTAKSEEGAGGAPSAGGPPTTEEPAGADSARTKTARTKTAGADSAGADSVSAEAAEPPLPIAGYDALTAREIISLLADLSPEQRARIRAHEQANRSRKTVVAKLDQLDG